ncbi:hypothetical protein CGL52_04055 [Pyrobaculum aerophilum]|uniref:Electron transfer flavoprotein alpha/beta-subunit N-terminal domain-containing protein n=1 Tax=Pyrobaculum aerophilum TaxID=13773 RepID=A0A371R5R4_9CREN|nr:hypothetical protein CGL52_04055 [Pyrobaculum aerophilum]
MGSGGALHFLWKDVLARVAARLGLGLTADCIDLKVENGRLAQFKPAFGGSVVSIIYSKTYPQMATIRPGIFQPLAPNYNRSGSVEEVRISPRLAILEKRGIEFELPTRNMRGL